VIGPRNHVHDSQITNQGEIDMAGIEDQQITIVGTVGGDPELKFTPSGAAVANFSVAVNHRRFDKQSNSWVEAGTDWHRITVWRQMAENVSESVRKGDRVLVAGRLASRSYQDRDGNNRTVWEITADEVAHSMKFATTVQNRAERNQGQSQGQGYQQRRFQQSAPQEDPWGSPPAPTATTAPGYGNNGFADEPPF
jgi:single-strand DNA-binding protein